MLHQFSCKRMHCMAFNKYMFFHNPWDNSEKSVLFIFFGCLTVAIKYKRSLQKGYDKNGILKSFERTHVRNFVHFLFSGFLVKGWVLRGVFVALLEQRGNRIQVKVKKSRLTACSAILLHKLNGTRRPTCNYVFNQAMDGEFRTSKTRQWRNVKNERWKWAKPFWLWIFWSILNVEVTKHIPAAKQYFMVHKTVG